MSGDEFAFSYAFWIFPAVLNFWFALDGGPLTVAHLVAAAFFTALWFNSFSS